MSVAQFSVCHWQLRFGVVPRYSYGIACVVRAGFDFFIWNCHALFFQADP